MSAFLKPHTLSSKVSAIAFFLLVAFAVVLFVPPWFLFCLLTGRRTSFTKVNIAFFGVVFPLFGIKVKVEGREHLQGRSFIMLANHQSFLDIPALLHSVSPSAFLAKKSLFQIPVFGQFLHYTGSIPVDRENPRANERLPFVMRERLQQGFTFTVFPEGTRSETGALLPFKNGIFRMIKSAPVPILPVTLIDTGRILAKRGLSLHAGELRIVIHKPIMPEEIETMTLEQLRIRVAETIAGPLPRY